MNGLYALKPWYTRRLAAVVDVATARGTSPDTFTAAGVAAAALAGVALAMGWWPVGALALAARLAGANLDGAVARARGVSRPWGFVLNEIGDRVSDLLMFGGLAVLAHRTGTPVWFVVLAGLTAALPTFASLSVCAAGGSRRNGGPLGKTERCLVAVVACAVPAWLPVLCTVVVVGSVLTAAVRLATGHRELAGP